MSKYLNIKTAEIYNNIEVSSQQAFETARQAALILTGNFNFTYNQFLFPYIDAHAIKFNNPSYLQACFSTIIARVDEFDEKNFHNQIKNIKNGGILWCISEKPQINTFKDIKLYIPDLCINNSMHNTASVYKFEIIFTDAILNMPDYRIRDFSGKLCSFFEIAAREVVRLGGKIICIRENCLFLSCDKKAHLTFKNLLSKLYLERFNYKYNFTNSFFDELHNI